MVEKEGRRLEVLKRRQERELNQVVHYELMRKALQVPCLDTPLSRGLREPASILCLVWPCVGCRAHIAAQERHHTGEGRSTVQCSPNCEKDIDLSASIWVLHCLRRLWTQVVQIPRAATEWLSPCRTRPKPSWRPWRPGLRSSAGEDTPTPSFLGTYTWASKSVE